MKAKADYVPRAALEKVVEYYGLEEAYKTIQARHKAIAPLWHPPKKSKVTSHQMLFINMLELNHKEMHSINGATLLKVFVKKIKISLEKLLNRYVRRR